MRKHLLATLGVAVVVSLGAYWYWSPYVVLHEMREAARASDAEKFNEHVDYPRLRESLKNQFSAKLTQGVATQSDKGGAGAVGAALGGILGLTLVDRMVDAFVQPEFVMHAMRSGKFKLTGDKSPGAGDATHAPPQQWQVQRKGTDMITLSAGSSENAQANSGLGFVMQRQGFAQWKLTEIRVPARED